MAVERAQAAARCSSCARAFSAQTTGGWAMASQGCSHRWGPSRRRPSTGHRAAAPPLQNLADRQATASLRGPARPGGNRRAPAGPTGSVMVTGPRLTPTPNSNQLLRRPARKVSWPPEPAMVPGENTCVELVSPGGAMLAAAVPAWRLRADDLAGLQPGAHEPCLPSHGWQSLADAWGRTLAIRGLPMLRLSS